MFRGLGGFIILVPFIEFVGRNNSQVSFLLGTNCPSLTFLQRCELLEEHHMPGFVGALSVLWSCVYGKNGEGWTQKEGHRAPEYFPNTPSQTGAPGRSRQTALVMMLPRRMS